MLARVITLRFDPVRDGFDDTPLREFLKDKEVLSLRDYFFVRQEVPYLAVLVTYTLPQPAVQPPATQSRDRRDASWKALVTEDELPLFNTLRDWRTERSKQEGIPPYVICTNRQFATMVKTRPQSLAALVEIDGFGEAKLKKYGKEILSLLSHTPEHSPPKSDARQDETDNEQPQ